MYRLCPRLRVVVGHLVAKTRPPLGGIYAGMYVSMIIVRLPSRRLALHRNTGSAS